jgi:Iap family predicted aminopeptidase
LFLLARILFLSVLVHDHAFAQELEAPPISRETIEARLKQFSSSKKERKTTLLRLFQEAGCRDHRLTEQAVDGERLPNVICTLPGLTDSVIIVGAHFDLAESGEGVVDNWTGASLLPSLFESLRGHARHHTFVFIGFTEEEKGLIGSKFYAARLTKEQRARTRAMVNLDTLGLSDTKVWASRADPNLLKALFEVAAATQLPLEIVNADRMGEADSKSFMDIKIPSITIHSLTQETLPILHTSRDRWEAVRLDDYARTCRLIAAYLASLDTLLE